MAANAIYANVWSAKAQEFQENIDIYTQRKDLENKMKIRIYFITQEKYRFVLLNWILTVIVYKMNYKIY